MRSADHINLLEKIAHSCGPIGIAYFRSSQDAEVGFRKSCSLIMAFSLVFACCTNKDTIYSIGLRQDDKSSRLRPWTFSSNLFINMLEKNVHSLLLPKIAHFSYTISPSNHVLKISAPSNSPLLKSLFTEIKLAFFPTSILPVSFSLPTASAPLRVSILHSLE